MENTTNVILFQNTRISSETCVYKLMHIHKVIHLVGTQSHPKASKKNSVLNARSTHLNLKVIVAFLENILLILALTIHICIENMENKADWKEHKSVTDNSQIGQTKKKKKEKRKPH